MPMGGCHGHRGSGCLHLYFFQFDTVYATNVSHNSRNYGIQLIAIPRQKFQERLLQWEFGRWQLDLTARNNHTKVKFKPFSSGDNNKKIIIIKSRWRQLWRNSDFLLMRIATKKKWLISRCQRWRKENADELINRNQGCESGGKGSIWRSNLKL